LVVDVISQAVERTVKTEVREIVAAVKSRDPEQVTQTMLVSELKLDKSTVSRRVHAALLDGYLVNQEEKRGRPSKLVTGTPLPDDLEIFSTPEAVAEQLHGSTVAQGGHTPPPPADEIERFEQLLKERRRGS
jgi:hypothetical protein